MVIGGSTMVGSVKAMEPVIRGRTWGRCRLSRLLGDDSDSCARFHLLGDGADFWPLPELQRRALDLLLVEEHLRDACT